MLRSTTRPSSWTGGTLILRSTKSTLVMASSCILQASASYIATRIFGKSQRPLFSLDSITSRVCWDRVLTLSRSPEPPFWYGDSQISIFAEIPDFVVPRKRFEPRPDFLASLRLASWLRGLQLHHHESYRGLTCLGRYTW